MSEVFRSAYIDERRTGLFLWTHAAILFFIVASILGLTLRFAYLHELPSWTDFVKVRHAHSHVAMLGWIYGGLFIGIVSQFRLTGRIYHYLYWTCQLLVFGMLISFILWGYTSISIVFSSFHILLTYVFAFLLYRDVGKISESENPIALLLLKSALFFLVLSSIGPWGLGITMATGLKGSALYYGLIQFYLHFQFNGWFIFAVLALIFSISGVGRNLSKNSMYKYFHWALFLSCIMTFALAVTWTTPSSILFLTNSVGIIIQVLVLIILIRIINEIHTKLKSDNNDWARYLYTIGLTCLVVKMLIQIFVVIPQLAIVSYTIRNFILGFIHLLVLGAVSSFILGWMHQKFNLPGIKSKIGIIIFLLGFIFSEIVLFVQGIMFWAQLGFMPGYYIMIFCVSLLMPLGLMLFYSQFLLHATIHDEKQ